MSEPALISPLLDGFVMGDPISDHDGVRCCPAMELGADKKYIVKVISIPAKQEKLAALLLAGAFPDRESAIAYFKELADDVILEAELLKKLSRFEGFVPYEKWQLVPMEPEAGYDIYLLSSYHPTLQAQLEQNSMTHLAAVNLGLDLCAALSVCRRFGYLYADLQPSNIYICNNGEYRIGDLGFISLASLPYASLPEKYHSPFTPPEISDAYSALNETMDTYAVGLILYMAYNDGLLPEPGEVLQAPKHADHELSTIILKACDADPGARWQNPTQMGQALISYLQRNSVNDTPIVPPPAPEEAPEVAEELHTDESVDPLDTAEVIAQVDEALDSIQTPEPEDTQENVPEQAPESEITDGTAPAVPQEEPAFDEKAVETSDDAPDQEMVVVPDEPATNSEPEADDENDAEEAPEAEETSVQNETEQMLAQADDLIAHELPGPVVAPEPIEVTLPQPQEPVSPEQPPVVESTAKSVQDPIEDESTEQTVVVAPVLDKQEATDATVETQPAETLQEATEEVLPPVSPVKPGRKANKRLIAGLIFCLTAIALLLSCNLFYRQYYLQSIDGLNVSGIEDRLTVLVDTDADQTLLTVLCTDTYGTTQRSNVVDGIAVFENLSAGMNYKIQVRIDGFHQLTGTTFVNYTTSQMTTVSDFNASIGTEDGSAILSFTVQGPDASQWRMHCIAPGEDETVITFSGHMVSLTDLVVGKTYTFTLEPAETLYLSGETMLQYTPSNVILAQDLQLHGFRNGALGISWSTPEGEAVSSWSVRCYNDTFDQTVTTSETFLSFEGLDLAASYTIEVTAEGMSTSTRTFLTGGSITFLDLKLDESQAGSLGLSWTYEGIQPADGWLLVYTVDGSPAQIIQCDDADATIYPIVPGGKYSISIQSADGVVTFGGEYSYEAPAAASFSGYGVDSTNFQVKLCLVPNIVDWDHSDVNSSDYTTSFAVGVGAGFTMRLRSTYSTSSDQIVTCYVIRDGEGNLVSAATESRTWTKMWHKGWSNSTIPLMPDVSGEYTIEIYFNFAHVTTLAFTVTE